MLDIVGSIAATGGGHTVLWVIAAILVIVGIVSVLRGAVMWGVILIVAGLLRGPRGVSLFS